MSHDSRPPGARDLRQRAEGLLAKRQADSGKTVDTRQLHELQVHQVELEMQNEALRLAQAEAEDALRQLAEFNARLEATVALRTKELITARDAAEAANQAKSSFLSNMSHELRTPLTGVMGMINLALMRATDPKQVDWLGKAKSSAVHLLSVVNDVLDFSKIDAGRVKLQDGDFRLVDVFDAVTLFISPVVSDKGLLLTLDMPTALESAVLRGDSFRLKQILLNLVGNAVKFTSAGQVSLQVFILQDTPKEVLLRFDVRDTGIGIAPQDLPRLFSAFEQADNSTTRRFGGTGLGLAISDRLVRMMGGDIGVESELGAGTLFWFTVLLNHIEGPFQESRPVDEQAAKEQLQASFAGARILLAEDDSASQVIASLLLESAGLVVDIAANGAAAVAMAKATPYALILMDMQMPLMGGDEACRAIRQLPGHAATPIIALTASVLDEDRQRCLAAGLDDHLSKPIQTELVFSTLLKWLSRPR